MSQKWWLIVSLFMAGLSLLGLRYVVNHLWPDPDSTLAQPQALFFTLLFIGLGAGAIPCCVFFNNRFSSPDWLEKDKLRLLRQGVWIGLLGVLLAYLQLIKALNWAIIFVLAGVFILIESFFLTRA